jgi:hypothetical protein
VVAAAYPEKRPAAAKAGGINSRRNDTAKAVSFRKLLRRFAAEKRPAAAKAGPFRRG